MDSVTQHMTDSSGSILTSWRIWFVLTGLLALLTIALLISVTSRTTATSPFFGDPALYEQSMEKLFSGEIPYIDFSFEHMPLSILPMAVTYAVARGFGLSFVLIFGFVSFALLFATGEIVVRIAAKVGVRGAGMAWVWIVAPILPLVLYRIDALSVLLTSGSVLLALQHREAGSLAAAFGGVFAKGWPVVLAASEWWRGKRRSAVALFGGTVLFGAVMLTLPGFRSGRQFEGIHQETLIGALVATGRGIVGNELHLADAAGAVYVEVGHWAVLVTLAIGSALAVSALLAMRSRFSWPGGLSLTAALVFALILGSPLLSAQFLLWPMPFVAIVGSQRTRVALAVAGGMSMLFVGYWLPGTTWWHAFVATRNLVLVVAAVLAVGDLRRLVQGTRKRESHR